MTLIAFFIAAITLAITPGPGIAYVVARTVAGGRTEGLASCLGTGVGGMIHVLAAAFGLSMVIAQSALAFGLLKYIGAAYLTFIGIRILFSKYEPPNIDSLQAQGSRRALLDGILVEALNVKTAIFFLAFLPQFIDSRYSISLQFVLLGSTCVLMNTLADVGAVFAAQRILRSDTQREARAKLLKRISGVTMIGLGVFLAFAKR